MSAPKSKRTILLSRFMLLIPFSQSFICLLIQFLFSLPQHEAIWQVSEEKHFSCERVSLTAEDLT